MNEMHSMFREMHTCNVSMFLALNRVAANIWWVNHLKTQTQERKASEHMIHVSLEHRSSHKQHGYICSNNQQYIVWIKIIIFLLCQKSLGY